MENYEVLAQIGKGNFGCISKIKRKSDNKTLVWKELDYGKMSEKEKQHIVAEVNILRELKHPNIVKYYDRIIDKKNTRIFIIMEFCEGGDIGNLIKRCRKNKDYIAEDVIWKIFTQIILALHECHTRKEGKILHRDLKPSNVFLDAENNVKLGDFGLSRMLSNESTFAYSHVGTPYYMSPEQIDEKRYNEKSDIWSLGCFLYELSSFNPPFEATNHLSLALKIKSGKVERIPSRYSEELHRVILWMLAIDQSQRPSIEDLINLPQVALRLRERRLKDNMAKNKKLEEFLKTKQSELDTREKELEEKLANLTERENSLKEKEAQLNEREEQLNVLANNINANKSNPNNNNNSGNSNSNKSNNSNNNNNINNNFCSPQNLNNDFCSNTAKTNLGQGPWALARTNSNSSFNALNPQSNPNAGSTNSFCINVNSNTLHSNSQTPSTQGSGSLNSNNHTQHNFLNSANNSNNNNVNNIASLKSNIFQNLQSLNSHNTVNNESNNFLKRTNTEDNISGIRNTPQNISGVNRETNNNSACSAEYKQNPESKGNSKNHFGSSADIRFENAYGANKKNSQSSSKYGNLGSNAYSDALSDKEAANNNALRNYDKNNVIDGNYTSATEDFEYFSERNKNKEQMYSGGYKGNNPKEQNYSESGNNFNIAGKSSKGNLNNSNMQSQNNFYFKGNKNSNPNLKDQYNYYENPHSNHGNEIDGRAKNFHQTNSSSNNFSNPNSDKNDNYLENDLESSKNLNNLTRNFSSINIANSNNFHPEMHNNSYFTGNLSKQNNNTNAINSSTIPTSNKNSSGATHIINYNHNLNTIRQSKSNTKFKNLMDPATGNSNNFNNTSINSYHMMNPNSTTNCNSTNRTSKEVHSSSHFGTATKNPGSLHNLNLNSVSNINKVQAVSNSGVGSTVNSNTNTGSNFFLKNESGYSNKNMSGNFNNINVRSSVASNFQERGQSGNFNPDQQNINESASINYGNSQNNKKKNSCDSNNNINSGFDPRNNYNTINPEYNIENNNYKKNYFAENLTNNNNEYGLESENSNPPNSKGRPNNANNINNLNSMNQTINSNPSKTNYSKINNTNNNNNNSNSANPYNNRFKFDPELYKEPINNYNSKKTGAAERERGYSNVRNTDHNNSVSSVNLKSFNNKLINNVKSYHSNNVMEHVISNPTNNVNYNNNHNPNNSFSNQFQNNFSANKRINTPTTDTLHSKYSSLITNNDRSVSPLPKTSQKQVNEGLYGNNNIPQSTRRSVKMNK